jgi:hypothetical protein
MRSELNECALGVDLKGIHSAFYFIRGTPGMSTARVVGFKFRCGLACSHCDGALQRSQTNRGLSGYSPFEIAL